MNARIQKNDNIHVRHVAKAFLIKAISQSMKAGIQKNNNLHVRHVAKAFLGKMF